MQRQKANRKNNTYKTFIQNMLHSKIGKEMWGN